MGCFSSKQPLASQAGGQVAKNQDSTPALVKETYCEPPARPAALPAAPASPSARGVGAAMPPPPLPACAVEAAEVAALRELYDKLSNELHQARTAARSAGVPFICVSICPQSGEAWPGCCLGRDAGWPAEYAPTAAPGPIRRTA